MDALEHEINIGRQILQTLCPLDATYMFMFENTGSAVAIAGAL